MNIHAVLENLKRKNMKKFKNRHPENQQNLNEEVGEVLEKAWGCFPEG